MLALALGVGAATLPLVGCSSLSRPEQILIAAEPVAAAAKPAVAAPAQLAAQPAAPARAAAPPSSGG